MYKKKLSICTVRTVRIRVSNGKFFLLLFSNSFGLFVKISREKTLFMNVGDNTMRTLQRDIFGRELFTEFQRIHSTGKEEKGCFREIEKKNEIVKELNV